MTNLQKEQTVQAIAAYTKAKDITKSELARIIGVSAATISNIANGKWDNIDDKLWRKVWNQVSPEHLAGLFQTGDCSSVFELCQNATENRRMIGLVGNTGMGKTTSLTAFANRRNVYYYYIDGTVSPRVFLKDLLRIMGVQFEGNLNAMLARIAEELNTMEQPLVILDECAKLSDKMILILHSLRDKTMQNCGYVLAGMPDFKNGLIKHVNRGTTGYAEFFRRINMWHELKGLSSSEILHILEQHGITEKEEQRDFKKLTRFGDLMNEINLYQSIKAAA